MKELLTKARDHIAKYGLAHETMGHPNLKQVVHPSGVSPWAQAPLCIYGAINFAACGNPRVLNNPEARAAWQHVEETLAEFSTMRVFPWADEKVDTGGVWKRGTDEAVALLDRAIERL